MRKILNHTIHKKKHLRLQHQLFLGYLLLSSSILFLFAVFFYHYVSEILITNEINSLTDLNVSFETQVESVIKDLDDTSANINYSNLMKDKLDSSFNLNINENTLPGLVDLFITINGSDIKADQINLYDFNGNVSRVGISNNTDSVNPASLTWLEKTKELKGIKLISQPYYTNDYAKSINSPEWFISLYRTYSNQYGRKVGAIETVKRCKSVFKSITNYNKKTKDPAAVYIFDSEGSLIYPYGCTPDEKAKTKFYYEGIDRLNTEAAIKNPSTGEMEHLVHEHSKYSNWTYITVQKDSVILRPVHRLMQMLTIIVAILLLASVVASYSLSNTMIKPIKHLKHRIQRLELDTLGNEADDNYDPAYDELAELYTAFANMQEKLNVSMNTLIETRQQEERSRNLALQSQTNPHFYYNTLSSIIILAENGQTAEVVSLCKNLSMIMRYITDSSSTVVNISDEIEYVKKYLYCMKVRYQDSLTYEIDIEEALLDQSIPKLLIQPIVENALKYGTNCLPPWHLSITGKQYDGFWRIDVKDSGTGFTEDSLQKIHEKMRSVDNNYGMPGLKINGLGIVNVYSRWKLLVKERAIFEIGNTLEGHSIVSIGYKYRKE